MRQAIPWTQEDLSKLTGLMVLTIARIENCEVQPTSDSMFLIAKAFGCPIEEIFEHVDSIKPSRQQRLRKMANDAAKGIAVVVAIFLIAASVVVGSFKIHSERAWHDGKYIEALEYEADVAALLNPFRQRAWDNAILTSSACRGDFAPGELRVDPVAARRWLDQNDRLVAAAPYDNGEALSLHRVRANCLAITGVSDADFMERQAIINNPYGYAARTGTIEFFAFLMEAARAARLGDTNAALRLIDTARREHPELFKRVFQQRRIDAYPVLALRPLISGLPH